MSLFPSKAHYRCVLNDGRNFCVEFPVSMLTHMGLAHCVIVVTFNVVWRSFL